MINIFLNIYFLCQLAPVGPQWADRTQSARSGPTGASGPAVGRLESNRPAVGRLDPVGLQRADGVLFLKFFIRRNIYEN